MANLRSLSRLERPSVHAAVSSRQRILLFGEPGVGKSTFAADLVSDLVSSGRACACISADPGSPAFGVPGALCRAQWHAGDWRVVDLEALCSLDAARFRLPLCDALKRLCERAPEEVLVIDAPGVVRGVAGAELLAGMIEAARIDVVLVVVRSDRTPPLQNELQMARADVCIVPAAPGAHRLSKRALREQRTQLWDASLKGVRLHRIELVRVVLVGMPPPLDAPAAWTGRQIAVLDRRGDTVAIGEATAIEADHVQAKVRLPARMTTERLLVRDATRTDDGYLRTARVSGSSMLVHALPTDMAPRLGLREDVAEQSVVHIGPATAMLVNGVFGDPLLHLRLRHLRRSMLFDLGETGRLPARIIHQASDVFITHAHFDHIAGFLWLLRSRIAHLPPCRVYGPPGIARHIESLVQGILWDRIGDKGPRFDVTELHEDRAVRVRVQAGRPRVESLGDAVVADGILLREPGFRVRAVTLDHQTPVLAFAFEPSRQLNVRKERLVARGLPPGPWLTELKQRLFDDDCDAEITLPNGRIERVGGLAEDLVLVSAGKKVAYATDLADTITNRERLTRLAKGAHTFFCEAAFAEEHATRAARSGHLTARACGEIATAAGVEHLIPFHFSKRYETEPARIYHEVCMACPGTATARLIGAAQIKDTRSM